MNKTIITDHALIRWIERIQGIDLSAFRMEIASTCAAAIAAGASCVITDRGTFVLASGKVVTILEPGERPGRTHYRPPTFGQRPSRFEDAAE